MRILAIRGKNLASLRGDFEVALNKAPLEQAGLFAITGHTGSGKSTLLDAMCLALFDKIPRLLGSSNVKVGRSDEDDKHRIGSTDVGSIVSRGTAAAYAEVDFIGLDKQTYQAHWEIKRARNKISGRLQKQSVTLKNLSTNEIIGQNKSDTLDEISDRIGLTFEQFRRSVLLAQGDFAAFLKAKTDERSALLERITGTEIYSQLSISAFRHFQEQDQCLNRIQDKIKYDVPLENQQRQDLIIKITELSDDLAVFKKNIADSRLILQWYDIKERLEKEKKDIADTLSELKSEKTDKQALNKKLEKIISIQKLRPLLHRLDELIVKVSELEEQLKKAINEVEAAKINVEKLNLSVKQIQDKLSQSEQYYQKIKPQLLKVRELDTQIKIVVQECSQYEKVIKELRLSLNDIECKKIDLDAVIEVQKVLEQEIINLTEALTELQKQRQIIPLEALKQQQEQLAQQGNDLQSLNRIYHSYTEIKSNLEKQADKQAEQQITIIDLIKNEVCQQSEHKVSFALLEEARRALLIMQESVTQGAQSLRGLLKNDQQCPVCGSLEHPWAEQDALLNQQYHQQTERVNELEKTLQRNSITVNSLQQKIEHEQSEQQLLNKLIKQTASELQQFQGQWDESIANITIKGESLQSIQQVIKNNVNKLLILPEIDSLATQIEKNKEQEKQAIRLQKKIDQSQTRKDQLLNKEKKQQGIISEQKILLNTLNNLHTQLNKQQQALKKRQGYKSDLHNERRQLFSGLLSEQIFGKILNLPHHDKDNKDSIINADDIDISLTQAISDLSVQYKSDKNALDQIKQKQIKLSQQCLYLQQHLEQNKQQKHTQENQLNLELNGHSLQLSELKILLQHDDDWIKQQRDFFDRLNNNLIKSESVLLERHSKLQQHDMQFESFPETLQRISKHELSEQMTQRLKLQQRLQNEQQENQLDLKQDDDKKQRIAGSLLELEAQKETWSEWGALNDLIGSASGHKFRIFAQSLTLESLLSHANEHLNDFARRYQLQRVPGTDLDLQIVDRDMADEVRSVQSLSGGESFLVSLALALGLASLSSTKTQVESLFIDEGFGTLDQETLDIAIASLDTLQGLGRKVGIISHVPILVERIGVRIVVEKMGGGQSRVSVVA